MSCVECSVSRRAGLCQRAGRWSGLRSSEFRLRSPAFHLARVKGPCSQETRVAQRLCERRVQTEFTLLCAKT